MFNITRNCCRRLSGLSVQINKLLIQNNSLRNNHEFSNSVAYRPQYYLNKGNIVGQFQSKQQLRKSSSNAVDDVQQQLQCIYKGPLENRMKMVKIFSLTTSLVGLSAQPLLMEAGTKLGGTGMAVFFCSFGGFFTFVTPLLLHFITKKYVTEIHYDKSKDEYTATTVSLILRKIHTKFTPSDVNVPAVPGMFTTFLARNTPLFVDATCFTNPEHYARIMGYDKPLDFKLNLKEANIHKQNYKQTK